MNITLENESRLNWNIIMMTQISVICVYTLTQRDILLYLYSDKTQFMREKYE